MGIANIFSYAIRFHTVYGLPLAVLVLELVTQYDESKIVVDSMSDIFGGMVSHRTYIFWVRGSIPCVSFSNF